MIEMNEIQEADLKPVEPTSLPPAIQRLTDKYRYLRLGILPPEYKLNRSMRRHQRSVKGNK